MGGNRDKAPGDWFNWPSSDLLKDLDKTSLALSKLESGIVNWRTAEIRKEIKTAMYLRKEFAHVERSSDLASFIV